MKLYLSSYRIPTPEDFLELLPKPPEQCKTAIIVNAKDPRPEADNKTKLELLTKDLGAFGLTAQPVDLYKLKDVRAELAEYDVLYAAGGNTFALRLAMKRSGFDEAIRGLLAAGAVYVGESAGAISVGTSLRAFETADSADVVDELVWEGVGLTDHVFVPHVDSADPEYQERMQKILQYYADNPSVVALNDNQAFIVNGTEELLVTGN